MNLEDYLSKKAKPSKRSASVWLRFCEFHVKSGFLWAGDPHLPNAADGCMVKIPGGRYVMEGIGKAHGRTRVVSRLRVRLADVGDPKVGKEVGQTGTDSAMIAICDLKHFDQACDSLSGEEVQSAIEKQTGKGFGIITINKDADAVMPFVPTGSDGTGPVFALMRGRTRIGFELSFEPPADELYSEDAMDELLLSEGDSDRIIYRRLPDGKLGTFWLGGELLADVKFWIWSDASKDPVDYRIRSEAGSATSEWKNLSKAGGPLRATEELPSGNYEVEFRTQETVFSGLKLCLA
jgi:hypothetical protein